MARLGLRLTDTDAQREFSVQHGVSEIHFAGPIEPLENLAVDLVTAAMAETHQIQRRRRCQFEIRRLLWSAHLKNPFERLGQFVTTAYRITNNRLTLRNCRWEIAQWLEVATAGDAFIFSSASNKAPGTNAIVINRNCHQRLVAVCIHVLTLPCRIYTCGTDGVMATTFAAHGVKEPTCRWIPQRSAPVQGANHVGCI